MVRVPLLFFGRSSPLSLSSSFFCHRAPDAKKRELFESQLGDRLSSGTSKGHNSATWNFPLREMVAAVVGASVSYASMSRHPSLPTLFSPSLPAIGRCIYAPVCFALVIHRVYCFKSTLRFQARASINSAGNLMRCLYTLLRFMTR